MPDLQVTLLLELANARHGPGAHDQPPGPEHDHLATAEEARSYLSDEGLAVPPGLPTAEELQRLREIADLPLAFERLPEAEWRPRLATAANRHTFRFDGDGKVKPVAEGWDAFVAEFVPPLFELARLRGRLRHCANPSCGWLFIDELKNHSRVWCDMGTCGSRAKMTRYRRRLASAKPGPKAKPVALRRRGSPSRAPTTTR